MGVTATDRINRIRETLIEAEPIICPERAVIWTESYKKQKNSRL